MDSTRSIENLNSNEELHVTIPIEISTSTTNKRKAQGDSDANKKQAGPKRRRKDLGSPSIADIVASNHDEHPDGAALQGADLSMEKSANNSGYESEDEAPETVSAATGLFQSRQAAADVAKAEETQRAATKLKRREHDARLKLQAKSTKKERVLTDQVPMTNTPILETVSETPVAGTPVAGTDDASQPAIWSIGDPLPELLPDEILAAVPEIPAAPIPSNLQSRKDPVKNKLKILHTMSNPRKRIKRGSTVYQFLEDDGGILPPKVAKRSMSLRESWLSGRCGLRGQEIVPRRKAGGGFVRR